MSRFIVIDRTCYSFSRKSSRSRNIKGPILQYELRIHRLWRCPSCARTVRTRGHVSSRQCTCADPMPFMSVVEDAPPAFDASKFVTYQTDELTTPTEKELLEDLPEWEGREAHRIKVEEKETKPRRGVGFLRAEPSTETAESQTEDSLDSEFGAGLDESELKAIAAKNTERPKPDRPKRDRSNRQPEAKLDHTTGPNHGSPANNEKDSDDKAPGRKRRRRRGRRNRKDSPPASGEPASATQASAVAAPGSVSADSSGSNVAKPEGSGADQSSKSSGDKRKPRRRRRRGGRNRSSPGSGDGPAPAPE